MEIKPKCSFRIIGLTEKELSEAIKNFPEDVSYRTGSYFKDREKKILRVRLNDKVSAEFLLNLLSNVSEIVAYDFYLSISTNQQTGIVDVPEYVLDLYRVVGGGMCFSYTYIDDLD